MKRFPSVKKNGEFQKIYREELRMQTVYWSCM